MTTESKVKIDGIIYRAMVFMIVTALGIIGYFLSGINNSFEGVKETMQEIKIEIKGHSKDIEHLGDRVESLERKTDRNDGRN